jgi:CheY-like chemotaxis protein
LTITRRLLELQGSEIRLKSREGKGSIFSFDLTFGTSTKKISKSKPHHKMLKESLKGTRVLIAEDNQINVVLAKEFFRHWDVDCDVAENGIIALQLVKTNDYDLVLMDLQMPEMDGYETTEEIRKLDGAKYKKLPIVALTASAMLNIQDRAFVIGMNDYISKPFNPDELYSKIKQYSRHFNN